MDATKRYNVQFYTSHNTSQSALTNFMINGQTVSLNGSENSNRTVQINGVTPDNTGTLVINCMKDPSAVFGMLSALVIESYTPGNSTPFSPADLRVLDPCSGKTGPTTRRVMKFGVQMTEALTPCLKPFRPIRLPM
jgi:hypothetical protein